MTNGIGVTGGLSVVGSIIVETGGLTIGYNGANIAGGITVYNLGMDAANGFTVSDGGATVGGGLSVYNTGLYVDGGDFVVSSGGISASGKLEFVGGSSDNAVLTSNAGLIVTGGLSTYLGGLQVT